MSTELNSLRVVLIGGAGFIGHNLALSLKRKGANVSVIDGLEVNNYLTFQSASSANIKYRDLYQSILQERLNLMRQVNIPLYVQDARDYHALSRLIAELNPKVVVHLAAVSHAGKSNKDPYSTFDHSLRTLENALDACRKNVDHFIYFSSSMIYGHFSGKMVTEETSCNPLGMYGTLKLCGEKIVEAYNRTFDLPYTIVRPSALYGERCVSRRVGQVFIETALAGGKITISGDGSDRLDFTYIDDLTAGIIKVIESDASKGETFNLTYGSSRSLADVASIVEEHFPGIDVEYVPKDKLTPDRGTLCVDKARDMIGYDPRMSLDKGFHKYIEWYKSFGATYLQSNNT